MSTDTNDPNWLDYVTAISAVATPLLVLALSALGWRLRHVFERRVALEDKPREDRIALYNAIFEPFIILFSSDEAGRADPRAVLAALYAISTMPEPASCIRNGDGGWHQRVAVIQRLSVACPGPCAGHASALTRGAQSAPDRVRTAVNPGLRYQPAQWLSNYQRRCANATCPGSYMSPRHRVGRSITAPTSQNTSASVAPSIVITASVPWLPSTASMVTGAQSCWGRSIFCRMS